MIKTAAECLNTVYPVIVVEDEWDARVMKFNSVVECFSNMIDTLETI